MWVGHVGRETLHLGLGAKRCPESIGARRKSSALRPDQGRVLVPLEGAVEGDWGNEAV